MQLLNQRRAVVMKLRASSTGTVITLLEAGRAYGGQVSLQRAYRQNSQWKGQQLPSSADRNRARRLLSELASAGAIKLRASSTGTVITLLEGGRA